MSGFEFQKTESGFAVTCRWLAGFTTERTYTKVNSFCPECGKQAIFNTPDVDDIDQSLCVYCGFEGFITKSKPGELAEKVKTTPLVYFEIGETGPRELGEVE